MAQEQIKEQEKQRVLGIFPNFYVSYVPNAAPLTSKQKFELAWKTTVDPVRFLTVGAIAGGSRRQTVSVDTGKAPRAMQSGTVPPTRTCYEAFIGGAILPHF